MFFIADSAVHVVMAFILLSALVPTDWANRVRGLEDRWLRSTGAIVDGLLRRSIRQSGFDEPIPLLHRLAVRGMLGLGFLVALGLLAPLPVSLLVVQVVRALAGIALAVMVTQTQQRL